MHTRQRTYLPWLCAMVVILASCRAEGTPAEDVSSAGQQPTTSAATFSASPALEGTVLVTRGVPYESSSISQLGVLDVYAPFSNRSGWPVVIMYHGGTWQVYKEYLAQYARRVAELGFVVFVPSWGHSGGPEYDALTVREQITADATQAACAAAFAAENASAYGGDASSFTVFGHSFGGNAASIVTLAPPALADGCLATEMPHVDTLVPWEGSWLLVVPELVDAWLVDDPTLLEIITPWAHLPAPSDVRFVFLRSEDPGEGRSPADATGPDGWLALRDPDGTFTAALEATGALDEDIIGPAALDTILIDTLEAQGADVTLEIMPDSSHEHLSDAGWDVFLAVFSEIGGY